MVKCHHSNLVLACDWRVNERPGQKQNVPTGRRTGDGRRRNVKR